MGHWPWFQILCSYSYAKVILSPTGKMGHKAKNLTVLPEGIYLGKSVKNPMSLEQREDVIHHGNLGREHLLYQQGKKMRWQSNHKENQGNTYPRTAGIIFNPGAQKDYAQTELTEEQQSRRRDRNESIQVTHRFIAKGKSLTGTKVLSTKLNVWLKEYATMAQKQLLISRFKNKITSILGRLEDSVYAEDCTLQKVTIQEKFMLAFLD